LNINAFTVDNIPLIKKKDDIGALISERVELQDNDIIVIASTIVSKSEGNIVALNSIKASKEAERIASLKHIDDIEMDPRFVQLVMNESAKILLESPFILAETKNRHVCVNAGIDNTNIENRFVLLLPKNPDESARRIKDQIYKYTGKRVSIIISDTNGRAFKEGQTGVAIGIAGIAPLKDWRGKCDLFGKVLKITNEAIVDEIAGFANLLMGEGSDGTPVVVIRGLNYYEEVYGIQKLYRSDEKDVIKKALSSSRRRPRPSRPKGATSLRQ